MQRGGTRRAEATVHEHHLLHSTSRHTHTPRAAKPKRAAAVVEEGEALGKIYKKKEKLKNGVELRINAGF